MDTFGELRKDHKYDTIYNWKSNGLIANNYNEIYEKYLISTHCDKCQEPYKNRTDKCMDHNHHTNEFRNFLCRPCNTRTDRKLHTNNTSNHRHIVTDFCKIWNNEYWRIQIPFRKKIFNKKFNKTKYSIEEVVFYRDAMYEDLGIEQFE
tara:strand:+ start:1187 stop:1633 length:447 start_codon:yes stop_codon:yes gene_type:complete